MRKKLVLIYGIIAYLLFNLALIYFILFISTIFEPRLIDVGTHPSMLSALFVNIGLISLFGLQHSIMARPKFKHWAQKIIPPYMERSTYVIISSLLLLLICWQWQAIPNIIWQITDSMGYWIVVALFCLGWLFALWATFLISTWDLVGLRHVYLYYRDQVYTPIPFKTVAIYKYIRHPIMLGTIIGLWATPTMTVGHLVLAASFTVYIIIGVYFEERDMAKEHGESYEQYRQQSEKFIPNLKSLLKNQ